MTTLYQSAEQFTSFTDSKKAKFGAMLEGGKAQARNFFTRLQDELPKDKPLNTKKMEFDVRDNRIILRDGNGNGDKQEWFLHKNALSQMVTKTDVLTGGVADKMFDCFSKDEEGNIEPWGQELLLHNLRTIYSKTERERVLIRIVQTPADKEQGRPGEIRGFLSDRYRRLNSAPIIEAFAAAAKKFDCVPLVNHPKFRATYYTDIKIGFSMFLPMVFEPVPGEVIVIGIMVESSDYGAGALTVRLICQRITCTNLAIMRDELRKVHLGTRLSEDINFSRETYESDTKTMALAVADITNALINPERINRQIATIQAAASEKVDAQKLYQDLRRNGFLLKADAESVSRLYAEADVELMPPGNTLWRASNALSLFANTLEEDGHTDRALDVRHAAGFVLDEFEKKNEKKITA